MERKEHKKPEREREPRREEEKSKARADTPLENRKRKHEEVEKSRHSQQHGGSRVKEEHRREGGRSAEDPPSSKVPRKEKRREEPAPRPTASFFADAQVPLKRSVPSVPASRASATPATVSVTTFGGGSASKAASGSSNSPATTAAISPDATTTTAATTAVPSPLVEGQGDKKQREAWTEKLFADTATAYQHLGRKLKRKGEQLYQAFKAAKMADLKDSQSPSAGGAGPAGGDSAAKAVSNGEGDERDQSTSKEVENGAKLASLWMTDACLLYAYSFWCEDQAAVMHRQQQRAEQQQASGDASSQSSSQNQYKPGNWHTIFNLIGYVIKLHETHGDKSLLAFCKLLEAHILRHLALRQQKSILLRTSDAAVSENVEAVRRAASAKHNSSSSGGSDETTAVSRAVTDAYRVKLRELNAEMVRTVDRSVKLSSQARPALAHRVLVKEYPKTWSLLMPEDEKPSEAEETDAMEVDGQESSSLHEVNCFNVDPTVRAEEQRFEWPLPEDPSNVFPSFVCFGRCLLVETAEKAKIQSQFHLQSPALDASP